MFADIASRCLRVCCGWLPVPAIALLLGACGGAGEGGRESLTILASNGKTASLNVEVADIPAKLDRGLTDRASLAPGEGMLFVIERRGPGFWMKDVTIPLSVAFITACGEIIEIQDLEPLSLDFHDTPQAFRFGLEVSRGWFEANGIRAGDRVLSPRMPESGAVPDS